MIITLALVVPLMLYVFVICRVSFAPRIPPRVRAVVDELRAKAAKATQMNKTPTVARALMRKVFDVRSQHIAGRQHQQWVHKLRRHPVSRDSVHLETWRSPLEGQDVMHGRLYRGSARTNEKPSLPHRLCEFSTMTSSTTTSMSSLITLHCLPQQTSLKELGIHVLHYAYQMQHLILRAVVIRIGWLD